MGRLFESSSQTNGAKLASMDATAARGGGSHSVGGAHACVCAQVGMEIWVSTHVSE